MSRTGADTSQIISIIPQNCNAISFDGISLFLWKYKVHLKFALNLEALIILICS